MIRAVILCLAIVGLCGCIAANRSLQIFKNPKQYLGRTVQVCGYMVDGANIVANANRESKDSGEGLAIKDKGPLNPLYRGRSALRATFHISAALVAT